MSRAASLALIASIGLPLLVHGQEKDQPPQVAAVPDAVFDKFRKDDRDVARRFYKKYLDVKGVAVLAAGEVADEALVRTHHIVTHMLAGPARRAGSDGEERHAAHHHRQGSGLHRHAGVPQPPEPGVP